MTDTHFDIFLQSQKRPDIDQQQSTKALWTDPHIAAQMLKSHLDPSNDAASYRHDTIDAAADWICKHFHLGGNHTYLDLGCGPGQYTQRMAERDLVVTGVDFSENSIRYAKEQAAARKIKIDYRCLNYLDIDFHNEFDLVTIISCDFSALVPTDRAIFLAKVNKSMKDTGTFLFDSHSRIRLKTMAEFSTWNYFENTSFFSEGSHLLLSNQFIFEDEGVCCTKYTIVKGDDDIKELFLWHRYYHLNDVMRILSDAGLQVTEVYGRIDGKPFTGENPDITVVAGKAT